MSNLATIKSGVMVGFSANKTVTQAQKETDTNRVDICTTKQLYLNGQRIGLTDDEASIVQGLVNDKMKAEDDAKFAIKLNITSDTTSLGTLSSDKKMFEKDKGMMVYLEAVLTYDGKNVKSGVNNSGGTPAASIQLTVKTGSTTTTKTMDWDSTKSLYKLSDGISITDTTTFSVQGQVYSSSVKSASQTFTAGGVVYVGTTKTIPVNMTSGDEFASLTTISSLTGLKSTLAGNYKFTFTTGDYAVFVVPKTLTSRGKFASVSASGTYDAVQVESGFKAPFIKQTDTVTKNSVVCDVFYISAAQSAGSATFTI